MEKSVSAIGHNLGKRYRTSVMLACGAIGVLSVGILSLLPMVFHVDVSTTSWPLVLVGLPVVGFVVVAPLSYYYAKSSKRLQIKYVQDMIDSSKRMATFTRAIQDEDLKNLSTAAEQRFDAINGTFDSFLQNIEQQHGLLKQELRSRLDQAWSRTQELMRSEDDAIVRNAMHEAYQKLEQSLSKLIEHNRLRFEAQEHATREDLEFEMEVLIDTREHVAKSIKAFYATRIHEYEQREAEWELFMEENYKQ